MERSSSTGQKTIEADDKIPDNKRKEVINLASTIKLLP